YVLRKKLIKEEKEIHHLKIITEEANEIKSNFLANMSFNVRVSLNNVLGFSQIITKENENISDGEWKEYSEIIQSNSEELINMVNNVLDLSRLEAGKTKWQLQDYDIITLCSDVISMLNMQGGKVKVNFQTEIDSWLLQIDVSRFTQLLLSLMAYPDSCDEERVVSFTLYHDTINNLLVFSIENSPLADPDFQSSKVEIRHNINRLTIDFFKGTYSVNTDASKENTIVFTYPCSVNY
ncbi:histidine kinase, partial [Bacteroides salyersiae]